MKKWLTFICNWSHQVNNMPSKVDLKSIPSELWGFNFANGCPSYKPVRVSELTTRFYAQDELKWKSCSAADVFKGEAGDKLSCRHLFSSCLRRSGFWPDFCFRILLQRFPRRSLCSGLSSEGWEAATPSGLARAPENNQRPDSEDDKQSWSMTSLAGKSKHILMGTLVRVFAHLSQFLIPGITANARFYS